jgi:crossover junction endodeoxyribonuclease RuvC
MKIIGIDPGTARMGYCIAHSKKDGSYSIIESSVLVTPAEMVMQKRLQSLYAGLQKIMTKHKLDTMVIERLFFNTNAKTAISVGQARGVAMLAAADWELSVFEYTALEAKKLLTGYGRADKKQMQEAVRQILGLVSVVKSDDANDAVAMAICHIKKTSGLPQEADLKPELKVKVKKNVKHRKN